MIKIYPVQQVGEKCDDYSVLINGQEAELNTARVSSIPFNRRWPGHQRQTDQTELVNFLSFATDEPVEITVKPKYPFYTADVRPHDFDGTVEIIPNVEIKIGMNKPQYFTVEPYGRNRALHVFADGIKEYGTEVNAKDVIYFGAGTHDAGIMELKSGQTVYIDEGAVVYATVKAFYAENIRIIGRGILDNSRNKEKILYEQNVENNSVAVNNEYRDNAVSLVCCKNVEIDGITIRDSLLYNIDVFSCENVNINAIKIIGSWRFNTDGVHFANCIDCSLKNSFVRTFDDSINVRGHANWEYDRWLDVIGKDYIFTCKNVKIENCIVWNDWGKCLQLGTETYGEEVAGVIFKNCKLIHVTPGGAMNAFLVDNAVIHDCCFRSIDIEFDANLPYSKIQKSDDDIYCYDGKFEANSYIVNFRTEKHLEYSLIKSEEELGYISDITVENVNIFAKQKPTFAFFGQNPKSCVKNITLKNIYWNGEKLFENYFLKHCEKNENVSDVKYKE